MTMDQKPICIEDGLLTRFKGPAQMLIVGGDGAGKTVAANAVSRVFAGQGWPATVADGTANVGSPEVITTLCSRPEDQARLEQLAPAAEVVLVLRVPMLFEWINTLERVLKEQGFKTHDLQARDFTMIEHLSGILFSRSREPLSVILKPGESAPPQERMDWITLPIPFSLHAQLRNLAESGQVGRTVEEVAATLLQCQLDRNDGTDMDAR